MSQFSNPASSAADAADRYIKALLEEAGEGDPRHRMATIADKVEERIAGMSGESLKKPEKEGKWSIADVIQHLADTELVVGYRMRMIIAHDEPPIAGFDQDLFAQRLNYRKVEPTEALAQLRALRRANLLLLDRIPEEDRQRVGLHAERGRESVERIIRMEAGHDIVHLRQIDRIRAAMGASA